MSTDETSSLFIGYRLWAVGYRGSRPAGVPHSRGLPDGSLGVFAALRESSSFTRFGQRLPPTTRTAKQTPKSQRSAPQKLHFSCLFLKFAMSLPIIHEAFMKTNFLRDAILSSNRSNPLAAAQTIRLDAKLQSRFFWRPPFRHLSCDLFRRPLTSRPSAIPACQSPP